MRLARIMDLQGILTAVGQFLVVTAGAFVLLCLLTSYLRFERLARQLEADHRAMDPNDAFQVAISKALGSKHGEEEPFCIVELRVAAEGSGGETAALTETLRQTLRSGDLIFSLPDERIGVVLRAKRAHVGIVMQRLRAAWGERLPFVAGVSSFPENGDTVRDLIAAADAALAQAGADKPFVVAPPVEGEKTEGPSSRATDPRWIDPLTGLLRPERVGNVAQKYTAARRRQGKPVSFILLDVDHLERYNKHYGRETGDAILKAVGQALETGVRETDLVARLGGEEFLIVAECAPAQALQIGRRLVAAIKRMPIQVDKEMLRVTVKAGIAGFPDHGGHPRYLLEKADVALGVARERGGNMCVLFDPQMQRNVRRAQAETF